MGNVIFDKSKQIDADLRKYAVSLGAELYGVASVKDYAEQFSDKPQPTKFIENAESVIIIGLPFEPGTIATVLRPELSGLRDEATEQVSSAASVPQGAEQYFLAAGFAFFLAFMHYPHVLGAGTFRYHNYGIMFAVHFVFGDFLADGFNVEGDFGNKNHIGAAGYSGIKRDPSRLTTHELHDHDPVV